MNKKFDIDEAKWKQAENPIAVLEDELDNTYNEYNKIAGASHLAGIGHRARDLARKAENIENKIEREALKKQAKERTDVKKSKTLPEDFRKRGTKSPETSIG
ncbi:MAG: hypothetical protein LBG88_04260 [Christensenellaceae bacterium]|jgi:hypothetical protein|nr:hypothetical protein [Christensenellaceae bacterium]